MARRHKYNVSTASARTYRGRTYHSQVECKRAIELDLLIKSGVITAWIPQVAVPLGEDFKTMVDFLVLARLGAPTDIPPISPVWFEEVKGVETATFRTVRRLWPKYGPCGMKILKRKGTGWSTEWLLPERD